MRLDPGMVQRRVVGHKVQKQAHAPLMNPVAETLYSGGTAEVRADDVARRRKAGTGDVLRLKVRKDFPKLGLPFAMLKRDFSPGGSRLPHAEKPEPVEALVREPIQLIVGKVVERCLPSQDLGKICQRSPRVDLVEGWELTLVGLDAGGQWDLIRLIRKLFRRS